MFKGKNTCKILKDIRRQIAESNDIEFVTSECKYQGDCSGTCPKCEAELRYLEAELNRRRQLGKVITLAGLSIGLSTSLGGCHSATTEGEAPVSMSSSSKVTEQTAPTSDKPTSSHASDDSGQEPGETPKVVKNQDKTACGNNSDKRFGVDDLYYDGEVPDDFGDVIEELPVLEGIIVDDPTEEVPAVYFTEEMPEFPGGDDALKAFLQREINYPDVAKYNGIVGTVLIEFIIEKDGSISNPRVKVPLFPDCDNEAVRAIMSMPKWKPGKNMGKPVRCFYQVPVSFNLK